jgi:hypothetical protein
LAALGRPEGLKYAAAEAERLTASFPCDVVDFMRTEVYPFLPEALEGYLLTHDPVSNPDYRPILEAARHLEVGSYVMVTGEGPSLLLPGRVGRWREESSIRVFIETCMLCEVSIALLCEDIRVVWGLDVAESDVYAFQDLFVDRTYSRGEAWLKYASTLSREEAVFKQQLMGQPTDYVRWKLGVPVNLDSSRVLNRLISDSYFTERLIKAEAGDHAITLGKTQLSRLKMERDTIFKSLDRLIKLREIEDTATSGQYSEMRKALDALMVSSEEEELPTLEDLEIPTLGDLE